jgi:hypothetical protein
VCSTSPSSTPPAARATSSSPRPAAWPPTSRGSPRRHAVRAEYRHALRQVVGRCIFGVDLNPMAVELCKVGLWMEAVEPGLPLTFLDSHIQHGNALLGTTPELMAGGIPDAAWEPGVPKRVSPGWIRCRLRQPTMGHTQPGPAGILRQIPTRHAIAVPG